LPGPVPQRLSIRQGVVVGWIIELLVLPQGLQNLLKGSSASIELPHQIEAAPLEPPRVLLPDDTCANSLLESRVPFNLWDSDCGVGPLQCVIVVLVVLECLA